MREELETTHYMSDPERCLEMLGVYCLRPKSEYRQEYGAVLWWKPQTEEEPVVGGMRAAYGDYFSHWSPLPDCRKMTVSDGAKLCR
jgi:hypothetical protein